jgi:hypothetical protein
MVGWKKLVLQAAGFGAGFGALLVVIVGGWLWYESRPHKEPAWNNTAIKASFKDVVLTTSIPKPRQWLDTSDYMPCVVKGRYSLISASISAAPGAGGSSSGEARTTLKGGRLLWPSSRGAGPRRSSH